MCPFWDYCTHFDARKNWVSLCFYYAFLCLKQLLVRDMITIVQIEWLLLNYSNLTKHRKLIVHHSIVVLHFHWNFRTDTRKIKSERIITLLLKDCYSIKICLFKLCMSENLYERIYTYIYIYIYIYIIYIYIHIYIYIYININLSVCKVHIKYLATEIIFYFLPLQQLEARANKPLIKAI